MLKYYLLLIISLVLPVPIYAADSSRCQRNDAYQAETTIDNLKSWEDLYRHFKRYDACDDGAIWEGYSDKIGRFLAKDWTDVAKLKRLCDSDRTFANFIFKHLDMTIPADMWNLMMINATKRCPAEANEICIMIKKANDTLERQIKQDRQNNN